MRDVRVSCDSIAVAAARAAGGRTIFAKNSDRPPGESQPLLQLPAADHAAGEPLRCQYVEIEQVAHTHAVLGSRPYWLWGMEHGVNEHRVAIGNHTIYTKDPVAEVGLLGMDLVRLGLERARSAAEAVEVIVGLIECYGQGGSGFRDTVWPYHNSFVIADAEAIYLLEASARHWALRDAPHGVSASNHVTIGEDWSRLSSGCVQHAVEMAWWSDGTERFDFARAYRDESVVPTQVSSGRYGATCAALASRTPLDEAAVKRLMRDHYESGESYLPSFEPDDERFFSVCMHAGAVGSTAASLVCELAADRRRPQLCWVALCNPCVAPYLPVFLEAPLPEALTRAGEEPAGDSGWWTFKALSDAVEKDWATRGPLVREAWRGFEEETARDCCALLERIGDARSAEQQLAELSASAWDRARSHAQRLLARL